MSHASEAIRTAAEASGDDPTPVKVKKLGHLVYEVSNIERTVKFWTEVMGFSVSDTNAGGMVFLRCAADHHAIALVPSKAKGLAEKGAHLRMNHLALEVESVDVLFKAREWCRRHGVPVVWEGRRGAGCNTCIHVLDPDGFNFELYCGMDQIDETTGRPRPAEQFRPVDSLEKAVATPLPETW